VDDRTLVIFTSDNGPWLSYGDHAGSAGPLREGKGTTFDGGVRVPCLMRWPSRIPAGSVCREPAMTIDVLPTLAALSGAVLPTERIIDGRDIWPLVSVQPGAVSPHEHLLFYWNQELQGVRMGKWKLHLPHEYRTLAGARGMGGVPAKYTAAKTELALFDLGQDPGESTDVAASHPDVVAQIQAIAERARLDLGDSATGHSGANVRPHGVLTTP
jgi:arylsulfatase A-like enzyme